MQTPPPNSPAAAAPPRRIFVDTQGWAEVFHSAALHHPQAVEVMQHAQVNAWELVTSNLILSELVPLLHSRNFRLAQAHILDLITRIRNLPALTVVVVDAVVDQQAWALLYAHPHQPWSHVDATSMVLMRQLGITDVLTADQHFAQAGFTVLLTAVAREKNGQR